MDQPKRKCKGKIGAAITADCRQQFVTNARNFRAVDAYTRKLESSAVASGRDKEPESGQEGAGYE